jgi:acyl-coenzyme A synthetase/AMP-(fatty) acid ligase
LRFTDEQLGLAGRGGLRHAGGHVEVVFLDDLYKNETGKVVKRALREWLISPR